MNVGLFPAFIRDAIDKGVISLDDVLDDYEPFEAFRVASCKNISNGKPSKADFKCQMELHDIRALANPEDRGFYGCSCCTDRELLDSMMKLPRRNKVVCKGCIRSVDGPVDSLEGHVNWFLYENAHPEDDFKVIDDGN